MESSFSDFDAGAYQPNLFFLPHDIHDAAAAAIDDEPLYVNAKQYYRILKRRLARARLDEVHRLSRQRKPYLHESRHKHAMRRPRGPGGRFLTAEEIAAQKAAAEDGAGPANANIQDHDMDEADADADEMADGDMPAMVPGSSVEPPPLALRPIHPTGHDPYLALSDPIHLIDLSYRTLTPGSPIAHLAADSNQQQSQQPSLAMQPRQHLNPALAHSNKMFSHTHPHGSSNPAPVTLSPPYAQPIQMQMHHVPHPHAHARHHHARMNYSQAAFPAAPPTNPPDLQRRTEDMLQFGTAHGSNGTPDS